MRRAAAAVALAAAALIGGNASNSVAATAGSPSVAIGPISIDETRAAVEKTLGGSGPVCDSDDTVSKRCYTDADGSLLTVWYGTTSTPESVTAIWLSQKLAKAGTPNKKTAFHFRSWTWFGQPVFDDSLPKPPVGWKVDGTGTKYLSFKKGAYGADKSYKSGSGWLVTLGEE